MNNYEYIIAGLPVLTKDPSCLKAEDLDDVMEGIASQCSRRDREHLDFFLSGFREENLNADFYRKALSHPNAFIREYFRFDLGLRNCKARYLNRALQREAETDVVNIGGDEEKFEYENPVQEALDGKDLLQRERDLDSLVWDRCEELTLLHVFDLDLILCFVAQLKTIERYLKLDPVRGKELFRKFAEDIRNKKKSNTDDNNR